MMTLEFLQSFIQVLKGYFKQVEEESIKDNFVIIYELLDEAIDSGYIQCVDINVLREYIKTDYHELIKPSKDSTLLDEPKGGNSITWRKAGIKHRPNECFLDVIEKINFTGSMEGEVAFSDITGVVRVNSKLSGNFFNFQECPLWIWVSTINSPCPNKKTQFLWGSILKM